MNPHELREAFLRFFEERGHRRVPGAPIVATDDDPTLFFTSAGMVPFKPYFMGQANPPWTRAVSVQKCFRVSDIESVGDTSHLTFFEMLGNFSFGDYFKAEVIPWAHEFLTQVLKLPAERLWPAIFQDDHEAFDLWRKQGFAAERIMRYGEEDNYWFSGDVGPCGPDSEIHYDFGEQFGCGPDCHPSHGHDRFVEIWNLVFMTYYCDGEKRELLPKKNIDTGSGFERVMSVLLHNAPGWDKNKIPSVYETEVFAPLIRRIEQLSLKHYGADEASDRAIRIVAEHARAVTFLIGDERTPVIPSNEERGYVCRRMLRRAVYFGRRHLGIEEPFMADLANTVVKMMKDSYPELLRQRQFVANIVAPEEQRFDQTLQRGLGILEYVIRLRKFVAAKFRPVEDHWEDWFRISQRPAELMATVGHVELDEFLTEILPLIVTIFEENERTDDSLAKRAFTTSGGLSSVAMLEISGAAFKLQDWLKDWRKKLSSGEVAFDPTDLRKRVAEFKRIVNTISGGEAFELHDTYGFPIDLTRDIAEQNGFTVDIAGFDEEMRQQRERGRAQFKGAERVAADTLYASLVANPTQFTGYQELETKSKIVALLLTSDVVDTLRRTHADELPDSVPQVAEEAGSRQDVEVFLAATPLYPEGGGQVGDRGEIVGPDGRVEVLDTQRVAGKLIIHRGRVAEGRIAVGDEVTARVDPAHRGNTKRNHTATHLLHAALRDVIGPHVRQAGSLVAPDHLRFDFTHTEAVTPEQLAGVESLVNEKVRQDVPVHTRETSFDEAIGEGVLAFFGDKYGDRVRVVEVNTVVPRFSAELCGGTHCERTGEIGAIIITGESSIGSGMRRIEALTGAGAELHIREQEQLIEGVAKGLGVPRRSLRQKIDSLIKEREDHLRQIQKLTIAMAHNPSLGHISWNASDVEGIEVRTLSTEVPSVDALRYFADSIRKQFPTAVSVVGAVVDDKPMFVAIVPKDVIERGVHAGNLLKRVAAVAGGSAGGRPDMAQGGGKDVAKLDEALAVVPGAVREMLGG
ncbi:MAG TPA: alanine--tRNA ligase [Dehalococcoidia bacterium]